MEHRGDRTAELPVKVLRGCFSEPLLLWPVERVSNKAVSEKAGWLASGTLLYMWRALQFAGKMRRDKNTNTSSPSELRAATSRHVALSRPVTRVNAQMLTAICHRVFVIKWEGDI